MGVTFIAPQGTYTAPAKLVSKSITENGTYDPADDNANGYSSVKVEVEGGGGSSDFSTAEVTIASTLEMTPVSVFGTFFNPNEEQVYITNPEFRVGVGHSETFSALLYQGKQIISIEGTTGSGFELDGDVELVAPEVDNEFRVYGDCTITIS